MEEQGDGSHVGVINAEPPVLSEVEQGGGNIYFILHPLLLIGQEIFAFFQRRIWDENNLVNIANVINNGNENDNNNDVDNDNNHQIEDAGAGAEDDMEFNQHVEEENSLPGLSKRRSREKDAENEKNGSKRFRAWKELSDSDSEEDPLPRESRRRRSREKDDEDEESTSSIHFRWWDEFASSDSEEDPLPGCSSKRESNEHDEEV
ncbi:hypothetical protein PAMP_014254 [Pampus punctatissimus]